MGWARMTDRGSLLQAARRAVRRRRLAPATRDLIKDDLRGVFSDIGRTLRRPQAERPAAPTTAPFDIDAVYTWVDHTDPRWREEFHKTLAAAGSDADLHPLAHHDARYEDHDELRYSLRSLWCYANWFRRIIVVTAGQRPDWLAEDDRVRIVDHDELLPPSALPTFNSHAIEACLHRIRDLSEHFVYLNDDFFFARPIGPSSFFELDTGRPQVFTTTAPIPADARSSPGQYAAADRTDRIVRQLTGEPAPYLLAHAPYALRVSTVTELEATLHSEFERTVHHPFRHVDDISVAASLAPWYALNSGRALASTIATEYVSVGHPTTGARLRRLRRYRHFDTFCLNWTEHSTPRWDATTRRFLATRFPHPAPWEQGP